MLINPSPKSNTERQQEFRERHPGYYGRLHARRRVQGVELARAAQQAAGQIDAAVPASLLAAPLEQGILSE